MKIYLGADHGGYPLKEKIKGWLEEWGQVNYETYDYDDLGAYELNPDDDYPDFAIPVAKAVTTNPESFGILGCRSGAGVVMAANKVKGASAAIAFDVKAAKQMRTNDNIKILAVSGDWLEPELAKEVIKAFLETRFEAGRHQRRLDKIAAYENKQ